jgi:hypothetical protein
MTRIALQLIFVVSTVVGGCATQLPAPDPNTAEASQDIIFCDVIDTCSTTHGEFEAIGTPGGATQQARAACLAACSGGTCSVTFRECCNPSTDPLCP